MSLIVLPPDEETTRTLGVPIHESELHDAVATLRGLLLRVHNPSTDLVIAHELTLAYGRPDVVVAAVELQEWRAWRRREIDPCTAPLPLATAIALRELGGKIAIDELLALNLDHRAATRTRRSVSTLAELGWIRRQGDVLALRLEPGSALITAAGVEAKLNNWRRAVRQVQSWESHVDAAWLAFPAAYMRHVPRTAPLRRFGLIEAADGQAQIVRRPSGPRAGSLRHVLIEQHLYARWLVATQRRKRRRNR